MCVRARFYQIFSLFFGAEMDEETDCGGGGVGFRFCFSGRSKSKRQFRQVKSTALPPLFPPGGRRSGGAAVGSGAGSGGPPSLPPSPPARVPASFLLPLSHNISRHFAKPSFSMSRVDWVLTSAPFPIRGVSVCAFLWCEAGPMIAAGALDIFSGISVRLPDPPRVR